MSRKTRFYDDGIRFECQGDGRCCLNHGRFTYVYVSFGDRKRLAAHLRMTTQEFTVRYTQASGGMVHLKDPDRDCPFFRDNRCGVHTARPWQCRSWPFWPENMHPKVWERDVAGFCPGVGKGRLYRPDEIEAIMRKQGEAGGVGTEQQGQGSGVPVSGTKASGRDGDDLRN